MQTSIQIALHSRHSQTPLICLFLMKLYTSPSSWSLSKNQASLGTTQATLSAWTPWPSRCNTCTVQYSTVQCSTSAEAAAPRLSPSCRRRWSDTSSGGSSTRTVLGIQSNKGTTLFDHNDIYLPFIGIKLTPGATLKPGAEVAGTIVSQQVASTSFFL